MSTEPVRVSRADAQVAKSDQSLNPSRCDWLASRIPGAIVRDRFKSRQKVHFLPAIQPKTERILALAKKAYNFPATQRRQKTMEAEDTTPRPRHPPFRTFEQFPSVDLRLESAKYAACINGQPRLDAYDYNEERNSPRWGDDDAFYEWLLAAKLPKTLAEMLYYHCPEVSFMLGPGHIHGVERIIDENQPEEEYRKAGFFIVASGPNGDPVAIDLLAPNAGEVGYLPHEKLWSSSSAALRSLFIPVCSSIGDFFESFEREDYTKLPSDYYDAQKKKNRA